MSDGKGSTREQLGEQDHPESAQAGAGEIDRGDAAPATETAGESVSTSTQTWIVSVNYPARFYPDLDGLIEELASPHDGVDSGIGMGVRDLDFFYEGPDAEARASAAKDAILTARMPIEVKFDETDDLDAIFLYVRKYEPYDDSEEEGEP